MARTPVVNLPVAVRYLRADEAASLISVRSATTFGSAGSTRVFSRALLRRLAVG
jgi:hypothetical protein